MKTPSRITSTLAATALAGCLHHPIVPQKSNPHKEIAPLATEKISNPQLKTRHALQHLGATLDGFQEDGSVIICLFIPGNQHVRLPDALFDEMHGKFELLCPDVFPHDHEVSSQANSLHVSRDDESVCYKLTPGQKNLCHDTPAFKMHRLQYALNTASFARDLKELMYHWMTVQFTRLPKIEGRIDAPDPYKVEMNMEHLPVIYFLEIAERLFIYQRDDLRQQLQNQTVNPYEFGKLLFNEFFSFGLQQARAPLEHQKLLLMQKRVEGELEVLR